MTSKDETKSNGPLFHRWLPDGEEDALYLDTGRQDYDLKVWFDRQDYSTGMGENDYPLSNHGALDAGPLKGKLEKKNLSESETKAIKESDVDKNVTLDIHLDNQNSSESTKKQETDSDRYFELGKNIYEYFLYPCISRFLNVLRVDYGQYWIREMPEWDSRETSLGRYYRHELFAKWSLDGGENWSYFVPNKPLIRINHERNDEEYQKFITEEDWYNLPNKADERENGDSLNTSEDLLVETHRLNNNGKFKLAFIRGVTLLEVATERVVEPRLEKYTSVIEGSLSIKEIKPNLGGLKYLVAIVATPLENTTESEIEKTLQAIDTRNHIVHEDESMPDKSESQEQLLALLSVARSIMSREEINLPPYLNPGSLGKSDWGN